MLDNFLSEIVKWLMIVLYCVCSKNKPISVKMILFYVPESLYSARAWLSFPREWCRTALRNKGGPSIKLKPHYKWAVWRFSKSQNCKCGTVGKTLLPTAVHPQLFVKLCSDWQLFLRHFLWNKYYSSSKHAIIIHTDTIMSHLHQWFSS